MRWALLSKEARQQFVDWTRYAAGYLSLLRFATFENPNDAELAQLLTDVLTDETCRRLWEQETEISRDLDSTHFHMVVPALGFEVVNVVAHVLYPSRLPDCRAVVLTWVRDGDEPQTMEQASQLAIPAPAGADAAAPRTPARRSVAQRITKHVSFDTPEQAAALAGDDAVALPMLSKLVGEGCQLTLSPSTRTVIWATRQDDGRWAVAELDSYTVIVRLPHGSTIEAARGEYKALIHATLPADPVEAVDRARVLLTQYAQRSEALRDIWRDLYELHPHQVPYIWHPVDEI